MGQRIRYNLKYNKLQFLDISGLITHKKIRMKKNISIFKKGMALMAVLLIINKGVFAQFGAGGPGTEGYGIGTTNDLGNAGPSPAVPFDGGMSILLLASGIGYGAKKIKAKSFRSL